MMLLQWLLLVIGLGVLTFGADLLVRGASRIAAAMKISPLVIGLTVVAFGTSAPELAVSIGAAIDGQADIALGNVIGSNIFNVLAILGLAAAITPLVVNRQLVRLDVPIMIATSLLVWLFCIGGLLSQLEGGLLFVLLLLYLGWSIWQARREHLPTGIEIDSIPPQPWRDGALVLLGLLLLVVGSQLLVDAAVVIAKSLGISELVIGLTILAAGTSLPELATSVTAGLRGQRDIAVGNVVGSCIFNLLGVLGLAAVFSSGGIRVSPGVLAIDLPVMVAAAVACFPIFFTRLISRREGVTFLLLYIAYTAYLVFDARSHHLEDELKTIIAYVLLPLTGLVIGLAILDGLQDRRRGVAD